MKNISELNVRVFNSLQSKLVKEHLLLDLVKHLKLPSQLPSSKVMFVALLVTVPGMFLLGRYLSTCVGGRGDSIVIQSGYLDRYVQAMVLNTSRVLPVESCRSPAKLDKPRWRMIKVIM